MLNDVPREVIDGICLARPSLANVSAQIQHGVAYLALCSFFEQRVHKELPEYFSVHNEELEHRFSRDKFKALNAEHDVFEVVRAARPGLTDAYRLKPDIREAIRLRIRKANEAGAPATMILHTGKHRLSLAPAISPESLHRTPSSPWSDAEVERLVPVDTHALLRLNQRLQVLAPLPVDVRRSELESMGHDGKSDVPELIDALDLLRRVIRTDLGDAAVIAHEYAQKSTGRLFAAGINLQSAPRLIKRAALNGLHAYDFSNCHFTMIHQLAERAGLHLASVADLLAHKQEWRSRIGAHCHASPKVTKLALIRLGYGASMYIGGEEDEHDSITELLGPERSRRFYAHPDVKRLQSELRHARTAILEAWPWKRGAIVNAMTLRYDPHRRVLEGENDTDATRLAHILQGYEAHMLCSVVAMYASDVVLLEHDGWTARRTLDVRAIEARIHEETGLRMALEEELIEAPC